MRAATRLLSLFIGLALAIGSGAAHAAPKPLAQGPTAPFSGRAPEAKKPDDGSWLDDWSILPVVFYSPETDVGFGLAVIRSLALPEANPTLSTIALGVIYTTKAQFTVRLEPDLRFGDDGFVHAVINYQRFPTRFFSDRVLASDDGEPYDERSLWGHLDGRITASGKWRVGLRWEYRHNVLTEYVTGGMLETSGLPGRDSYFASGLGPVLSLDTRDDPRRPTNGVLGDIRLLGYSTFMSGGDLGALQLAVDVRGYVDLGHGHVLAGELGTRLTAGELPFQLLPRLGGGNFLRGWYEGHLRGRHAFLAQVEWRFPIWQRIGGAAFFGLGETVANLEQLDLGRVRAAGGVGVRYLLNKRQNVNVRLDLAWGSGFGAYVDVLEAF